MHAARPVSLHPPVLTTGAPGLSIKAPGRLVWAGIAGVVVVMAAVAGWALLANGPPSSKEQDRMAREWLARNKADLMESACIRNFPYATNPVNVDAWNSNTRAWLDALVAGGVYESRGTNASGSLVYAHGPNSERHIRDGRLCLADDVELREVALQEQAGGDDRVARLSVGFGWTGVPAFASSGRVGQVLGDKLTARSETLLLVRKDGDWAEAAPGDLFALAEQLAGKPASVQRAASPNADSGFDIGRWLSGLFAFGSGPAQTAEAFYRALEEGKIQDAVELVHPAERSPATDEKIQLLLTTQRMNAPANSSGSFPLKAVVVREDETSAVVRMEVDRPGGRQRTEQRIRLLKHEGRWYVSLQ